MSENSITARVQKMGILKPAEEIFEAIVDPEIMSKYFISTSTGKMEKHLHGRGKTSKVSTK
jgi:uncharacterized protein YndB with AHSA1/START domain